MRTLQLRILAAAMGGALLTTLLGVGGVSLGIRAAIERGLANPDLVVPVEERLRCEVAPEEWRYGRGLLRITAHRPDGTASRRGEAPLPPSLVPELGQIRQLPDRPTGRFWSRHAVARVAEDGPCAVLHTTVDLGPSPILGPLGLVRLSSVTGMVLGAIVAFLVTIWFAILPLLQRIRVLDEAAAELGTVGATMPVDPTDDALGRVARTLSASHQRLLDDRAELQARHVLLERHLAGVAHDLRTPIASVQLTLEAIDAEAPEIRAELGTARMELGALEALADNLLQASRLRGGLDPHTEASVDLGEVCRRLGTRFGILGRARGIRVHVAVPDGAVLVGCDPSLAERALANLLHNAIVHGPAEQPVGMCLDVSDGRFEVAIQSGGPPLPEAVLEAMAARRLTEPDPSRTRQNGLGLGITNEVAERCAWTVRYQAPQDGGLRVEVEGPVSR